jgi:hypothetical protein
MATTGDAVGGAIVCGMIGLFAGVMIGNKLTNNSWHAESINYGYAQYDPQTGEWEWLRNAEKPEAENVR